MTVNQHKDCYGIYLPHGVDATIFKPKKVEREDKFTFLWMGRDESRKALGRTILAFEQIHKHVDAQLLIHTDWKTRQAQRTRQYLEHKQIPFKMSQMTDGNHANLVNLYNMADVYVNSCKAGGFELSLIESMACGKPVICTNHDFMREQVVHGKSGFLVPVERMIRDPYGYNRLWGNIDINELSKTMLYLYNKPRKARSMGRWRS